MLVRLLVLCLGRKVITLNQFLCVYKDIVFGAAGILVCCLQQ